MGKADRAELVDEPRLAEDVGDLARAVFLDESNGY